MTETILYKDVYECTQRERIINIISLRSPDKPELEFDNHYCHFVPPKEIIYKLNYVQMTDDDMTNIYSLLEMQDVLNDQCNELLIYYEKDPELDKILFDILSLFQSFPLKKTVYLADEDDELHVSFNYSQFFTRYKFVLFITLPELQLYNITEKTLSGFKKIITKYRSDSLKLTCQTWFKKFISRIFSCGVKRLLQTSGTCYLNAVINGIVLSPVIRSLFLNKMKEYVDINPMSKAYISSPLNADDMTNCKRFAGKYTEEIQFLYRLLYNLLCKDTRPFPRVHYDLREDIFIEASKDYFSSKVSGQGGFSFVPMLSFLYGSGTKFLLALEDENDNILYVEPKDILLNLPTFIHKHNFYELIYDSLLQNKMHVINPDTELILYIPRNNWSNDASLSDILDKGFVAQSSYISMHYENILETTGHAVTGFFCDQVPKIYDSGSNMIFEANWFGNISDFTTTFTENYKEMNKEIKLHNFNFGYILFCSVSITQNDDVCFVADQPLHELTKELTWDVPIYRLYRLDDFTPLFHSIVYNRVPIKPDFFDLSANKLAQFVDSNYGIVKMILEAYPDVNFTKYPEVATIILKDREFQLHELEFVSVVIDDAGVLYDIYKDLIDYGINYTVTDEVVEEVIADGQIEILNELKIVPKFTTTFMMQPTIIEQWDEIFDSYSYLPWNDYEQNFIARYLHDENDDMMVLTDFERLTKKGQYIPYRVIRHFERLWPQLQEILYNINWQDVQSRWEVDPLNRDF